MLRDCKCGKHMLKHVNEGVCLWCGYGVVRPRPAVSLYRGLLHLPRDLGAILREGRRLSPHRFENVRRV